MNELDIPNDVFNNYNSIDRIIETTNDPSEIKDYIRKFNKTIKRIKKFRSNRPRKMTSTRHRNAVNYIKELERMKKDAKTQLEIFEIAKRDSDSGMGDLIRKSYKNTGGKRSKLSKRTKRKKRSKRSKLSKRITNL